MVGTVISAQDRDAIDQDQKKGLDLEKGKENYEKGREKEKESGNVRKKKNENVIEKGSMKEKEETGQGRENESVVDVIKQPKKFGKSKIWKTKKEIAKKQNEKPEIRKQVIKNV